MRPLPMHVHPLHCTVVVDVWPLLVERQLGYDPKTADTNDGLFWMDFSDFVKQFSRVYFARLFKHVRDGGEWCVPRVLFCMPCVVPP